MAGTGFAETTPYGDLECGRAKSGRRDLMGSQRVARPSLERGMEAQVGRRELRNTKASPREGEETAENPLPPIQCVTYPIGHPQGGLLSITLCFSNAGNASAAIFLLVVGIRSGPSQGFSRIRRGIYLQASARALADM